jgi:hypothetical protein
MEGTSLRASGGLRLLRAALILSACTANACTTHRGLGVESVESLPPHRSGEVIVENNSWERVTVYVSRDRASWRLGIVEAFTRGRFALVRSGIVADGRQAQLIARPLAGKAFNSDAFPLSGTVVWTIENQVNLSHISAR